jgi:protein SCO1/2
MPSQPGRLLLIVIGCISVLVTGCSATSAPRAPGPRVGQQADAKLPPSVGAATLETSDGPRLTLSSLAGKVVVISDVMTLCQETCPLDTANVVAAARAVERAGLGGKVVFLSITIDPGRDTVAQLAAYRKLYAPAPADWLVATGRPDTLTRLWKQFGVYIQRVPDKPPLPHNWRTGAPLTYDLTHSDEVFFLDQHGHERFLLEGTPHVAAGAPLPRTLRQFMDATGQHNITHPDPLAWTVPQELQVLSWLTARRLPTAGAGS